MKVAVLGLGEAGGTIGADLVAAGCDVLGWDPLDTGADVPRAASNADAARGADVVISLTTAESALDAARSVADALSPETLYADLNTSAPALKREVAAVVSGVRFADVALMENVPGHGLRTPALASGSGADRFVELLAPLGMPVETVGAEPGEAAALKLLRSVFVKGLAAAVVESLEAAKAAGAEDVTRAQILTVLDEPMLERLVTGTRKHARRRAAEMDAAAQYLEELGVEPHIARATATMLDEIARATARA